MAKIRSAGQITSKGPNKWLVRIYLGEDSRGKRRYSSKVITGKIGDARKALTGLLCEKDLGVFVEPSNQTLNEYLDRWFHTSTKQRVSEATYNSYETMLRVHIRPRIGTRKISQIKPLDIQKIYADMQNAGLSSRTVRYAHAVISMALRQAMKWNIIAQNPCERVELPKHHRKETKAFSPEQAARFLKVCRESKHGLFSNLR